MQSTVLFITDQCVTCYRALCHQDFGPLSLVTSLATACDRGFGPIFGLMSQIWQFSATCSSPVTGSMAIHCPTRLNQWCHTPTPPLICYEQYSSSNNASTLQFIIYDWCLMQQTNIQLIVIEETYNIQD